MKYLIFLIMMLCFFVVAANAFAASDPPLFSCTRPDGTVIADYDSGVHGIPGHTGKYTGSDTVYQIDSELVLQCFCPADGHDGIQSNWWKVSELSESERETFIRRGWIFVPDGSRWGLDAAPYLVKNADFSCGGRGGHNESDDDNNHSNNDDSGQGGGDILGVSTLAATGNTTHILTFALGSVLFGWATYRLGRE